MQLRKGWGWKLLIVLASIFLPYFIGTWSKIDPTADWSLRWAFGVLVCMGGAMALIMLYFIISWIAKGVDDEFDNEGHMW